jgi:paraquat-inducible protein A
MSHLVSCQTCGLVQEVDELPPGTIAQCARCGFTVVERKPQSSTRTAALALAALILYVPANFYPVLTTYYWGARQDTTIFAGIRALFQEGSYFIGGLVFLTSVLSPVLKMSGLLLLALTVNWSRGQRARAWVYRAILIVDPWNMLEVMLLAIAVAIVELGKVATVLPGPGMFSFAAMVVLTICAALAFDPRMLWEVPPVSSS